MILAWAGASCTVVGTSAFCCNLDAEYTAEEKHITSEEEAFSKITIVINFYNKKIYPRPWYS